MITKEIFEAQYNEWVEWLQTSGKICRFCHILPSLVLHETANFYITLAVGAIVEGYCLICSKYHFSCFGDLPSELVEEFYGLKDLASAVVTEVYGHCLFYEHGQAGASMKSEVDRLTHCYHAHLHCVPLGVDILPIIREQFAEYTPVAHLRDVLRFRQLERQGAPYFYYQAPSGSQYIFPIHSVDDVPSQFLRRCAAEAIGEPHKFDWHTYEGWVELEAAHEKLGPKFASI